MLLTTDTDRRPLRQLRISVTDRCNLRCAYCMPAPDYRWLPRAALLDFREIRRLAGIFVHLGVQKLRLTGGEPLLRRDLPDLVALFGELPLDDLALTTNGVLLADLAPALARAGLRRVTVSLDTLDPAKFHAHTRHDALAAVHAGIDAARAAGLPLKLNTVVIRGFNDDEIPALLDFARTVPAELRFIEYMNVHGDAPAAEPLVPCDEILGRIADVADPPRPLGHAGAAPALRFELPDGTRFGVIAAATAPFCNACDRGRLTADGRWHTCLFADDGLDLKALLRDGASDEQIAARIQDAWSRRTDRGAEQYLAAAPSSALTGLCCAPPANAPAPNARRVPLQMHVRGG